MLGVFRDSAQRWGGASSTVIQILPQYRLLISKCNFSVFFYNLKFAITSWRSSHCTLRVIELGPSRRGGLLDLCIWGSCRCRSSSYSDWGNSFCIDHNDSLLMTHQYWFITHFDSKAHEYLFILSHPNWVKYCIILSHIGVRYCITI